MFWDSNIQDNWMLYLYFITGLSMKCFNHAEQVVVQTGKSSWSGSPISCIPSLSGKWANSQAISILPCWSKKSRWQPQYCGQALPHFYTYCIYDVQYIKREWGSVIWPHDHVGFFHPSCGHLDFTHYTYHHYNNQEDALVWLIFSIWKEYMDVHFRS